MICNICKEKLKKMYEMQYSDLDHFSDFPLIELEKDEKSKVKQDIENLDILYCHNF